MDEWPVVAVVGGSGGVGASTFAAVLALQAARRAGVAVLVDLDPAGGGIDVLLGIEDVPGARWPGLLLHGGSLQPGAFVDGLPGWGPVTVLSSADGFLPAPDTAEQGLQVARTAGPVIVDVGRAATFPMGAQLTVLIARADLPGVTAARVARQPVPGVAVLVRSGGRLPARRVADSVGAPLLGRLPACERLPDPLTPQGCPAALTRVARGIVDGVLA